MKKNHFICFFTVLLIGGNIMAQSKDSVPARPLIEKGTSGDLILGKENKKKQLNASPQLLPTNDSIRKKETGVQPKKKEQT
jgi:hypothetical protein